VEKQQKMGRESAGVVMEGRDIATVVFPDADVKIYLTADLGQRAERRRKEYSDSGSNISIDEIRENIKERDRIDSTREVSPLKKADDAFVVDTSSVTIEEQVDMIIEIVKETAEKKGIDLKNLK